MAAPYERPRARAREFRPPSAGGIGAEAEVTASADADAWAAERDEARGAATDSNYDPYDERPSLAELALDGPVGPTHRDRDPRLSLRGGDPWGGNPTGDPGW